MKKNSFATRPVRTFGHAPSHWPKGFEMKAALAVLVFVLSEAAGAGGLAPGVAAGLNDAFAQQQWQRMSDAWIECMKRGGGDSCGPAPQPPANLQTQSPGPKRTDSMCVSRCLSQGYLYGLCESRCSW